MQDKDVEELLDYTNPVPQEALRVDAKCIVATVRAIHALERIAAHSEWCRCDCGHYPNQAASLAAVAVSRPGSWDIEAVQNHCQHSSGEAEDIMTNQAVIM